MYDAEIEPQTEIQEPTSERRLATVRRIAELIPIEGADRIEIAVVDGWRVITQKGVYRPGDLAVYLEIDSWVPTAVAPFLTKPGHPPRVYKEVEGQRLRSMRMRGELSQGLLLSLKALYDSDIKIAWEDQDVTEILGILKWEKEIPANLRGQAKGYFPAELRKTDQERVQNAKRILQQEDDWEVTIKLDGSSMTCFIDADDQFSVCSRNLQLVETEGNAFWETARKQDLEAKLRAMCAVHGGRLAIQGELMGPGIQGNQEQLTEFGFYLFDIWDVQKGQYLLPEQRHTLTWDMAEVPLLPVVQTPTLEEALELAEGPSLNLKVEREGVVFKSMTRPGVSFKAVSNTWLLAKGE
jgi:RNA ligase (TIGR02306 family)